MQIQEYISRRLPLSCAPDEQQLCEIVEGVEAIYRHLDRSCPHIVFCEGPLDRLLMPVLMDLMLKLGREQATATNFVRTPLDDLAVKTAWHSQWFAALDNIDWTHANGSIGGLISDAVKRFTDRTLYFQLAAYLDQELGNEQHEELEQAFRQELHTPFDAFRRSTMLVRNEEQLMWSGFVDRLPLAFRAELESRTKTRGLHFTRNGTNERAWLGVWDWYWLATYDYARTNLSCKIRNELGQSLDLFLNQLFTAAGFLFCEHYCFVYLKPRFISFDDRWRLHDSNKPAVEFMDGTRFFYWHGVAVPEKIITSPQKLTIKEIERAPNTEIRRIMIERYGLDQYIRDCGAKKIHEDDYGILYRKDLPSDEPIVMLKVINSTPEPDGTYKPYFIRVPPRMQTAKQAVAWTFRLPAKSYRINKET